MFSRNVSNLKSVNFEGETPEASEYCFSIENGSIYLKGEIGLKNSHFGH